MSWFGSMVEAGSTDFVCAFHVGTMDDHGEKGLDFVPNPHHFLVCDMQQPRRETEGEENA
jgi:hypothetical protein